MDFLFNPENKFWSFMTKITDVFCIAILWFLTSIPIITMGAATTSVYQFTLKQADDEEGYVWKSFWKAFRKNFVPATIIWIVILVVGVFIVVDLWACLNVTMPSTIRIICFAFLLCLALAYVLTALYVFPILSRFDLPVKKILANGFVMAMGNLYISITILVIHVVFLALSWRVLILFPVFMSLAAFFSSYFFRHVFNRYLDEEEEPDQSWSMESDDFDIPHE